MKRKKASKKLNITALLLVALLVIILSIGGLGAKYKGSEKTEETEVTFSAELARTLTLTESKAEPETDGTYTLDTNADSVKNNSYKVLPGVDIPKDPKITIVDKTDIAAYLYVELIDTGSANTISYAMSSDWKKLDVPNRNVYVYVGGGTTELPLKSNTFPNGDAEIYLLKDNKIIVSERYAGESFDLTFKAYLLQVIGEESAATVFTEAISTS